MSGQVPDHLIRAIAREAGVRVTCVLSTGVVADAAARHKLSPAAACAVGKALTSGLLLATLTKGPERVTVQLVGDGPIGSITVDATDAGNVRGYAQRPEATGAWKTHDGRLSTADVLGRQGVVNVTRDLGLKELYQGQVALVTGEVDEDVEAYLRTSEQVPSALGCEVLLDNGGEVRAAGGILVQALPGGDPDKVREVQHALRTGRLHEILASGERAAEAIAAGVYTQDTLEVLGDRREVRFKCRCSDERIGEMLMLLGTVDLDELIAENKPAEITCNFCNAVYTVDRPELERIRAQVAGGPRQSN
jgi:molecular chaperone Hsp33